MRIRNQLFISYMHNAINIQANLKEQTLNTGNKQAIKTQYK